jgi:hypothetical protein
MTSNSCTVQPTAYGAREYYSAASQPHFRWFDCAEDESRFLASPKYRKEAWQQVELWCCCACIADLPVAIPIGQELVKNFHKGDPVLAGSVKKGGAGVAVHWKEAHVEAAGKLDPSDFDPNDNKAVLINYGQGKNAIVATYQYIMTTSGKLKQARDLSVGDSLLSKEGAALPINSLKLGEFEGPRYHLGTTKEYNNPIDGHLLCVNDIVIADYVLQKHRNELPRDAVG